MTDLVAPKPGIVDHAAPVYNARLVRREDETDSLAYFWVRFDGEPTPFESGQYMTIGVMVDGKIVAAAVLRGLAAGRDRAPRATSSTSASSRAGRSPRCSGSCRSATACG